MQKLMLSCIENPSGFKLLGSPLAHNISWLMILEYGITKGLYLVQDLPHILSSMVGMHVEFVGKGGGCKDMV